MSTKSLAPAPAKSKPKPPEKTPEPRPTRLEQADLTTRIFDFERTMEKDLVRVTVAAARDRAKQQTPAA